MKLKLKSKIYACSINHQRNQLTKIQNDFIKTYQLRDRNLICIFKYNLKKNENTEKYDKIIQTGYQEYIFTKFKSSEILHFLTLNKKTKFQLTKGFIKGSIPETIVY